MVFIVLPVCVVFVVGNLFYSGETSTETLYNATGGVLGYIDSGDGKVAVRNSSRSVIGYVDDNGTYDKGRKTIAKSRLPGLLFCHE